MSELTIMRTRVVLQRAFPPSRSGTRFGCVGGMRGGRTGSLVPYDATLDWYGDELRSHVELVNEVSHVHAKLLNDSAIWERAKS